ncbi:MAG: hypothetical protein ACOY3Y_09670 [Acidobacteriota bacterium]
MCRSALASICTSLLATATLAGDTPPDPARVATLESEVSLAKKPGVYLVLDPPRRTLEIRSRGLVLDSVPIRGIEVVSQGPLLGSGASGEVRAPAVWTIVAGAGDTDREVIAPAELKPLPPEGEEEEEPTAKPSASPTPTSTPIPEPPVSYRARLDTGWDIWVCTELPPDGVWQRFVAAVRDGWERLRGEGEDHPPAVAIAMQPDDARRIHHLMRTGVAILVAAGAS